MGEHTSFLSADIIAAFPFKQIDMTVETKLKGVNLTSTSFKDLKRITQDLGSLAEETVAAYFHLNDVVNSKMRKYFQQIADLLIVVGKILEDVWRSLQDGKSMVEELSIKAEEINRKYVELQATIKGQEMVLEESFGVGFRQYEVSADPPHSSIGENDSPLTDSNDIPPAGVNNVSRRCSGNHSAKVCGTAACRGVKYCVEECRGCPDGASALEVENNAMPDLEADYDF